MPPYIYWQENSDVENIPRHLPVKFLSFQVVTAQFLPSESRVAQNGPILEVQTKR